jgi:DNA-binding transcriptional regulator LsrR (DeoR family)
MPSSDEEYLRQLYHVARMHYLDKRTKTQIANELRVSNTQVARLLREAERRQIVQIHVSVPPLEGLQNRLRERFSCLKEAIVLATGPDYMYQLATMGRAAADHFESILQDRPNLKVGLSGGNTLYEVVEAFTDRDRNIEIYPTALVARGPYLPDHMDQMLVISRMWQKCGRKPDTAHYATVPPFERAKTPDGIQKDNLLLLKRSKVREVWNGMHDVDVILAGVGAIDVPEEYGRVRGRTILRPLSEIGITDKWLQRESIVGDISYSLFDKDGNQRPDHNFFLTVGVNHLKHMAADYPQKRVVLIAGKFKEAALKAALRGRLCNALITTDSTAEMLLSE